MLNIPQRIPQRLRARIPAQKIPFSQAGAWNDNHAIFILYAATICAAAWFAVNVFLLPFSAYLSFLNIDDSFYYFQIARNFGAGHFSTFDGVHLTNGYHPLWAAVLTPIFAIVRDPILAVRVVKMVELAILLVASLLIMVSGRKAGWPALLALAVPISLFSMPVLYQGMETSIQVLLCAALLYGLVQIFVRPDSHVPTLGVGLICCLLPWARLETLSISLSAMLAVTLHAMWINRRHWRIVLLAWTLLAISAAGYFIYNKLVFNSAVPVSGAVKNYWSTLRFNEEGGYNFLRNAKIYYWIQWRRATECMIIFVVAALPWLLPAYRKGRYAPNHALDAFFAILVAAYAARLIYSAMFVDLAYDNAYYYVPYFLVHALAAPYVIGRALLLADALTHENRSVSLPINLVASGAILLVVGLQAHPWSLPNQWRQTEPAPSWLQASYDGANWINQNLPEDAVIGSPDSGVLGYFAQRRIINLDGLVNETAFFTAMKNQSVEQWIRAAGVTHLADAVRTDKSNGCASIANGSIQTRPYSGSCTPVYKGTRFHEWWLGRLDDMQFQVYAWKHNLS